MIGAGNRAQDSAIVRPMSSALLNRLVHVHLKASHRDWLEWARYNEIHPLVLEYLETRPDHLWSVPPKHEEPFSTPRSWHMLSDSLKEYGDNVTDEVLELLAFGCLSPHHAGQFKGFVRQIRSKYRLSAILKGDTGWPHRPEDRDVLYFLAHSLRAQLLKQLPAERNSLREEERQLAHRSKALLTELAGISLEIAQMVVHQERDEQLPSWFLVEVVRDLPRLVERKSGKEA